MAETPAQRANITFKDQQYTINVPSEGQLLALSFAQGSGVSELMGVIGEVVHYCVGDKLWATFIKGLASGEYSGEDFTALVSEIMNAVKDTKGRPDAPLPILKPRD